MKHKRNKLIVLCLLMAAWHADAALVTANGNNHTLATAQSLNGAFTTEANAEITDATTIPHASVQGSGQNAWDYYSFTLNSAANVLFDIDHGMPALDSYLKLFNSDGVLLSYNDDGHITDAGSIHGYDSYLNYAFSQAGRYVVGVGRCCSSALSTGQGYTLNVSSVAAVPEPETYALLVTGLVGLGIGKRRWQRRLNLQTL